MLSLSINNRPVEVQEGQTILEAARSVGIEIPTLCAVKGLLPTGACRICVVEVEGMGGLVPSCSYPAANGMKIKTHSPRALEARKTIVELLLADHPDDCLYCGKSQNCQLQDLSEELGIRKRRYSGTATRKSVDVSGAGILRDPAKCVLCGRCVAVCNEIMVNDVLDFGARGARSKIVCDADVSMGLSSCVQCGACVEACPTGALLFKSQLEAQPGGPMQVTKVTCPYCGVGCQIDLHHKSGKVIYATATAQAPEQQPNQGMLCVKGRFGLDFLNHEGRLTTPMLRKNGQLEPATWDEALDFTATKLAQIKDMHGADAIGFLSSAKVTNEENYAMMRLARGVVGTNNIDHCARL
jgi:predicted molibdopterin-dependent oxidoreductase YjgC